MGTNVSTNHITCPADKNKTSSRACSRSWARTYPPTTSRVRPIRTRHPVERARDHGHERIHQPHHVS